MSNSDIMSKIEVVLSSILSKKHDMKIKIKFVDSEGFQGEQRRDHYRASRNDINARERD